MHVFQRTHGNIASATGQPIPHGLRTVVELRESPSLGILVGYVEVGTSHAVLLFLRSPAANERAQQKGPFDIDLFDPLFRNSLTRKIRAFAGDRGMNGDEFLNEVQKNRPSDWQSDDTEATNG